MKANIEVTSRGEGEAIRAGLEDPEMRAYVVALGTMKLLPDERARLRLVKFLIDRFDLKVEQL